MDRDGWLALLAGVLGVLCVGLLLLGPVLYIQRHGTNKLFGGKVDGKTDWQARSDARLDEDSEREQLATELGLYARYTIVPVYDDIRNTLYRDKNYAALETYLDSKWALTDPMDRFRYGRMIGELSKLSDDYEPEHMLQVLDGWVAAYPQSHRARLVRGRFHTEYAWYHRGGGWGNTVSRKSAEGFHQYLAASRADLEAAHGMFPQDPNPLAAMITVAMAQGESRAVQYSYYERALALDPGNIFARDRILHARQPKWGGSWRDLDKIREELPQAAEYFPLVNIIDRVAAQTMVERGDRYREEAASYETIRRWADPYFEQLKRTPHHPELKANAAYYLSESNHQTDAEQFFDELGDTFYEVSTFRDLLQYNDTRGHSYAGAANQLPPGPLRQQRIEEAHALAPNQFYTNYVMGKQLVDDGKLDEAIPYFERSREARPNFVWHTYRLAEIAEKQGKPDEAVRIANEVLELDPNDEIRDLTQAMIDRNS